ncbi:MAG: ribonuclease PH, partial [Candidatus Dormibacteraceae bacterium]
DQVRPVRFTPGFLPFAEGSVLIELGNTRVVCAASVDPNPPPFLRGQGVGWVTAEYRMLPRATSTRTAREGSGRIDGRSVEIQRLIGRSLRAAVDRSRLGERTLVVDCDVLTADGGTRTAAITGGFVALVLACRRLSQEGSIEGRPIRRQVAAISAGIVEGAPLLDLAYAEDSIADVDCNAVLTDRGETVELQLSAERGLPGPEAVEEVRRLCERGVRQMLAAQQAALEAAAPGALSDLLI